MLRPKLRADDDDDDDDDDDYDDNNENPEIKEKSKVYASEQTKAMYNDYLEEMPRCWIC